MGKKTSIYLTDEMQEKLASSSRSLPEVIRAGLNMTPATVMLSRADLREAFRDVAREVLGEVAAPAVPQVPRDTAPEKTLVGAIFGEDPGIVRDSPKPHLVAEGSGEAMGEPGIPLATGRPRLPTLDRRITESMHALVTEWAAALDNEPEGHFTMRVETQVRLLLESGVVPADVARGLAQWQGSDSSQTPELIPEVVEQVMEAGE